LLQKWIFPVFSTKNWEIVQFHLGQIFCSASFRWGSQCFYETTGLEPTLYSIATHCDIVLSNSVLKAKNSQNSTKTGKIKSIRKNCPFSPWTNFPHSGSKSTFLVINHPS
jgi:hypothetical protein